MSRIAKLEDEVRNARAEYKHVMSSRKKWFDDYRERYSAQGSISSGLSSPRENIKSGDQSVDLGAAQSKITRGITTGEREFFNPLFKMENKPSEAEEKKAGK